MDKEPRNVDCNGSGRSIIPIYSGDQYLLGGKEDEVKHDLENPSPSLGSGVTEVSQGPAADANYPAATLQPSFEHMGTVMQQCTYWQHYVVTAISNIERRLASMDRGINDRLNAMNGRLAVLEDAVLRPMTTTAAMTTSCIAVCPVSPPKSFVDDSDDLQEEGVKNRGIGPEHRKSQRRSGRLCAQQGSSGSDRSGRANNEDEWQPSSVPSPSPAEVNRGRLRPTILSSLLTGDLNAATCLSIPTVASGPKSPLEANNSEMQFCKVEEPTGEEPANHLGDEHSLPLCEYACVLCGKAFAKIKLLHQHFNRMHKQRRRFNCELCSKTFADRTKLKSHIDNVHKNLRNFPCDVCGHSFKRSTVLKEHVNTVHNNLRKFPCDICGRSFKEKGVLKMHVNCVHKNLRSFPCDICGHSSKKREDLKKHVRSVHGNLREFSCAVCGRSFARSDALKLHLVRLHPGTPLFAYCTLSQINRCCDRFCKCCLFTIRCVHHGNILLSI